ncbi:MAD2L1-binding protein-like [Gigantopelta aegis]|uniref:MAD2L1-binding protein-like n=1 Tax=Gigantopelta aegis TaxID=1735272 RepID=UPI001B88BA2F|nr:MAD2L1-binding protein-like [Gigantopelta aegis]
MCDQVIAEDDEESSSRGVIVNELIKYCMYEREQIPLPFENIKRDIDRDENARLQLQNEKNFHQFKVLKKVVERKSQNAVFSLEQLFDNLSQLFERYPEVHQVLILLGGTVVSPKETYLVNLPPTCPDAEPPADRSYVKYLYRQLITQDLLGDVKSISPTNMTVFVRAPRDCGLEWFLPKPAFKVPQKSKQFEFNISCTQSSSSSYNLTQADEEFDISGIQPLSPTDLSTSELSGSSVFHTDDDDMAEEPLVLGAADNGYNNSQNTPSCIYSSKFFACPKRHSSTKCSQQMSNSSDLSEIWTSTDSGFHTDPTDMDMIWFQSPVVVKGYKNKLNHMD